MLIPARVLLLISFAVGMLSLAGCYSQETSETGPASAGGTSPAVSATRAPGQPRPKLRPGAKTVVLSKAGDKPYDKTFDDLRFSMTVGERFERPMLTKGIEEMDGHKIRIRGYILPTPQKHGIKEFVLVRDNQECCFGPGAALYDCILVQMKRGNSADFTIRPIAVEGTFNVHVTELGGKQLAVYQMDGDAAQ
ncbi:MAG TPA: DUF3299 domain-containing protein [Lacipirellulaceae bacterium]|jgi:hypothetical protein|nr:DUF3299 domain-containing protein [Lacipirellulaceae bacterium]